MSAGVAVKVFMSSAALGFGPSQTETDSQDSRVRHPGSILERQRPPRVPQAHGPPQTEQTNASDSQEQPVVHRDVNWKISHVVQLQQVMINDPFSQVEQS